MRSVRVAKSRAGSDLPVPCVDFSKAVKLESVEAGSAVSTPVLSAGGYLIAVKGNCLISLIGANDVHPGDADGAIYFPDGTIYHLLISGSDTVISALDVNAEPFSVYVAPLF